jgi:CDP-paratose 2-epimerase
MAGVTSSPQYLLDTNLVGAINCFEMARKNNADVVFLSTSRVYPVKTLNSLDFKEEETRFSLTNQQTIPGASEKGISEDFPIAGVRTLYGSTKLSAELILEEYVENYGIRAVIDRCGLITGPWQMGKIDQGVIVFWMAHHFFQKPLSYIGFDGSGKQVRDLIDVEDLFELLLVQLSSIEKYSGRTYNVGGGSDHSLSLLELSNQCQKITGNTVDIQKNPQTRPGDLRIYISDSGKIIEESGWKPKKSVEQTLSEIYRWLSDNKNELEKIIS